MTQVIIVQTVTGLGKALNLEQENTRFRCRFETSELYNLRNDRVVIWEIPFIFFLCWELLQK